MSPPATSKTSCCLCCGDVAREVGDVCVCVLFTKTDKEHFVFVSACVYALCINIIMCVHL